MSNRIETDSMGPIEVDDKAYYGAQTARSLHFFNISDETLPLDFIKNYAKLKIATARANHDFGKLSKENLHLIEQACEEIIAGRFDDQFPLRVWQTGSGTQTNMNVNEVIANRANEIAGQPKGTKKPIHPNDHVNLSQSSNDTFPSVMYITAALRLKEMLLPNLEKVVATFHTHMKNFENIIKIGRTHLQDATPITLSQEFSGFAYLLELSIKEINHQMKALTHLAIGGTAVGTGLNAPLGFDEAVCKYLNQQVSLTFIPHPNKFAALSAHDELVNASHALSTLAGSLLKIANDIRWASSGPRCGLGELMLPENEPGSSIMPGKVNPTQCEALTMIAIQVKGLVTAIDFAGSQGHFQLNVYNPLMIFDFAKSVQLLSDGLNNFNAYCLTGLKANTKHIEKKVHESLMLVTALTQLIGYDTAAKMAHEAFLTGESLKEVCLKHDLLTAEAFDAAIDLKAMTQQS
jgi:fumarate hydratase class II